MAKISVEILKELAVIRAMLYENKKVLSDISDNNMSSIIEKTDTLENAICEQSEDIESALADIENALCEITEGE